LNQVEAEETLLHDILPTSSFPSDHAVVSMAVAVATLLW
jgi:membrane-associated phospholipid phosphatase